MVALREAYEDRDYGLPAIYDAENRLIAWEGGNHSFPFGYKGYFRDLDTGMYYLGPALRSSDLSSIARRATDESEAWDHRYYNPLTGRFLNRDPIREAGGLNLYAHTRNDHINRWDVRGLSPYDGAQDRSLWDPFFGFVFRALSDGGVRYNRYHADNARFEKHLTRRFPPIHIGSGTLRPNFCNPILRHSQQAPGGSFDGLRAQGEQEIPTQLQDLGSGIGPTWIKSYILTGTLENADEAVLAANLRDNFPSYSSIAKFKIVSGSDLNSIAMGDTIEIYVPSYGKVYVQVTSNIGNGSGFEFTTLKGHFESGRIQFLVRVNGNQVFLGIASRTQSSGAMADSKYTGFGGPSVGLVALMGIIAPNNIDANLDHSGHALRGIGYWAQTSSWVQFLKRYAEANGIKFQSIEISDRIIQTTEP